MAIRNIFSWNLPDWPFKTNLLFSQRCKTAIAKQCEYSHNGGLSIEAKLVLKEQYQRCTVEEEILF